METLRQAAAPRLPDTGERLLAVGGHACSDAELLGLLLDGGAGGGAARARAEVLLRLAGGPGRLERLPVWSGDVRAVGSRRRAALVRAALELGRRAVAMPLEPGTLMLDAAAVYGHFCGRLPQLEREQFHVVLLDGRNRVQGEVRVSEGSLTAALVHPREVFAPALRAAAAALVLVHNHPSGDPTPSAEDAALTERLRQVGEVVGIRVLDHVVIGQGRYVSMAEGGRW